MARRTTAALVATAGALLLCGAVVVFVVGRTGSRPAVQRRASTPPPLIARRITEQDCEGKGAAAERKRCFNEIRIREASVQDNVKLCLSVDDYPTRQACISRGVRPLKSEKECGRIADPELREECLDFIGILTKDPKRCERFGDEPNEKQECLDRITAFQQEDRPDINACSNLKTLEYNFLCLFNAMRAGGAGCEAITDRGQQDVCFSRVMLSRAANRGDCEKIPVPMYRRLCLSTADNELNPDYKFDEDGDGLNNDKEIWVGTDPFNPDSDGDGLNDFEEVMKYRTNPLVRDTDGDGLSDFDEVMKYHTDPNRPDTDGDGFGDWDEVMKLHTDPTVPDGKVAAKGKREVVVDPDRWMAQDSDRDGLLDVDEIFYGTDAFNPDTDGDGILDGEEVRNLSNPLGPGDMDFDDDGLSDKEEAKRGTNPTRADTNDDGVNDFESIMRGIDPTGDDTDRDGLGNGYERKIGTDPLNPDTDGDGLSDGDEVNKYGTNPLNPDTDGDGLSDLDEVMTYHTDPLKPNTAPSRPNADGKR
jgi:hypothetical protein